MDSDVSDLRFKQTFSITFRQYNDVLISLPFNVTDVYNVLTFNDVSMESVEESSRYSAPE